MGFFLGFYLCIWGFRFSNPVARLVGWRANLCVNLHYPGMEFPIAVVAGEIAAYCKGKAEPWSLRVWKEFKKTLNSL